MSEISYLIGAGASYGTIPIVNELNKELINFAGTFTHIANSEKLAGYEEIEDFFTDGNIQYSRTKSYKLLHTELLSLTKEIGQAASIDTLAKRLQIRGELKKLEDLKNIFTLFFLFLQNSQPPSPRHDLFFASILSTVRDLPKNIKILSWNYDSQFETAYSGYFNQDIPNMAQVRTELDLKLPEYNIYPWSNSFRLIKLNGTAEFGYKRDNGSYKYFEIIDLKNLEIKEVDEWVKIYMEAKFGDLQSNIDFAWNHYIGGDFFTKLSNDLRLTKSLIIIGYSFPYFNKRVDSFIFEKMDGLKTIYIQDPNWQDVKERVESLLLESGNHNQIEIIEIENLNQFFLPNEL